MKARPYALATVLAVTIAGTADAQTSPAAPNHKHYTEPAQQQASPTAAVAPRLQNVGTHTCPVTTRNKNPQLFINQSVILAYAFNHCDSHRSFREAAPLDPGLAMA